MAALVAAVAVSGRAQADSETPHALRSDPLSVLAYVDDPTGSPLFEDSAKSMRMPAWVERECFALPDARDVHCTGDGVIGFIVEGTVDEIQKTVADDMTRRGWRDMPCGIPGTTGYFRTGDTDIGDGFGSGEGLSADGSDTSDGEHDEGDDITWALVSMTQIGSAVSVVLQTH